MPISTYAELKAAIQTWTDDTTAADNADTYIDLVEAYFRRKLRTREMAETATLTLDSEGEASLPADFLEVIRVSYDGSPKFDIEYASPQALRDYNTFDTTGLPGFYTIEGGVLRVRPIPATTVTLHYYETIPALSDSTTTNWLLDRAPDLYLTACEAEHAWRVYDTDRQARCSQRVAQIMSDLMLEDAGARASNGVARVKGITP